jgi:hypothetical protein
MFPLRYELVFYIPKEGILHENLKSYIELTGCTLYRKRNVFVVKYELGFISQKRPFFIVTAVKTAYLT